MQKPYPRVWIPGVLSKETVIWTAQRRYPYHRTEHLHRSNENHPRKLYDKAAAEVGYTAGPENFGYLIRVHVQDTEEKGDAERPPVHVGCKVNLLVLPTRYGRPIRQGYFSPSGRRAFVELPPPAGPKTHAAT